MSFMGRRKTSHELTKATGDRHKPAFSIRLPAAYAEPIDRLIAQEPGSDRSEIVRKALREWLSEKGLWPGTLQK